MTGRTRARCRRGTRCWTTSIAIVIASSSIGCWSNHVQLEAPAATAPAPERLEAYRRLRPSAYGLVDAPQLDARESYGPEARAQGAFLASLHLADGREVNDPTDLLAVVPATSDTALAARRFEALAPTQMWAFAGTIVGVLAGITTFVVAGQVPEDSRGPYLMLGSSLEVGSLALIFLAANYQDEAIAEATRALASYEDSLRQGLALCAVGDDAVPCEELGREEPPPSRLASPPVSVATPTLDAATPAVGVPTAQSLAPSSAREARRRSSPLVVDSSELVPLWESKRLPYAGAWSLDLRFHGVQLGFATLTQTFRPEAAAAPTSSAMTGVAPIGDVSGDSIGVTAIGVTASYYVPVVGYSPELSLGLLPALHVLGRSGSTELGERERIQPSLRIPLAVVARYGTLASRFANSSLSVGAGLGLEWLVGDAQWEASQALPVLRLELGIDTYQFAYEATLGSSSLPLDGAAQDYRGAARESHALTFTYLFKPWD